MAGEEPPYLTVGTDVSAKYKGAFCEAKIKKVIRSVKCKLTFKNNVGAAIVTDDLVKGTLRVGAHVEAKHPEKKEYLEAVINKLHDYSQYTVVFDDGDETTLRRTSLCLKSGRHFAESETLDQLPLTHPEHFGTPVIGNKGRKRRSLNRSALTGESSDEEVVSKKKVRKPKEVDADMGKVVCVEMSDRKKQKDNWFPAVVVSPGAHQIRVRTKDEYLVRSFKDGKYHVVIRKDTKEFTKEIGAKVENNTLKTAVDKAMLYLDKDELPAHWDRELLFGAASSSNDNSDQDSDSDTSDDEPSEEKDRFVAQLYKFMDDRGTPINKAPAVSNKDLNLYKLFKVVQKMSGYNRVTNQMQWKTVYNKMGLPTYSSTSSHQIKQAYKKYLHSFEDFYRKLGCTMGTSTRSGRARNLSGRGPPLVTRERDREFKAAGRRLHKHALKVVSEPKKAKEVEVKEEAASEDDIEKEKKEKASEPAKPAKKVEEPESTVTEENSKNKSAGSGGSGGNGSTGSGGGGGGGPDEKQRPKGAAPKPEDKKVLAPDSTEDEDDDEKDEGRSRSRGKGDLDSLARRRGRKRSLKKKEGGEDGDKSLDSDDETRKAKHEIRIVVGDRVKVKYGRGRQEKIYEAKVLKLDEEEGSSDRIFFVHYTGWNMRYDEWVKKHRIVENLTRRTISKRTRTSMNLKGSKGVSKRGRPHGKTQGMGPPPGSRKGIGGSKIRSTRSDRNSLADSPFANGLLSSRRTRRSSGPGGGRGSSSEDSDLDGSDSGSDDDERAGSCDSPPADKKASSPEDLDTSMEDVEMEDDDDDSPTLDEPKIVAKGASKASATVDSKSDRKSNRIERVPPPKSGRSLIPKNEANRTATITPKSANKVDAARASTSKTESDQSVGGGVKASRAKLTRSLSKELAGGKEEDDEADEAGGSEDEQRQVSPRVAKTRGRPLSKPSPARLKEIKAKAKDKKAKSKKAAATDSEDEVESDDEEIIPASEKKAVAAAAAPVKETKSPDETRPVIKTDTKSGDEPTARVKKPASRETSKQASILKAEAVVSKTVTEEESKKRSEPMSNLEKQVGIEVRIDTVARGEMAEDEEEPPLSTYVGLSSRVGRGGAAAKGKDSPARAESDETTTVKGGKKEGREVLGRQVAATMNILEMDDEMKRISSSLMSGMDTAQQAAGVLDNSAIFGTPVDEVDAFAADYCPVMDSSCDSIEMDNIFPPGLMDSVKAVATPEGDADGAGFMPGGRESPHLVSERRKEVDRDFKPAELTPQPPPVSSRAPPAVAITTAKSVDVSLADTSKSGKPDAEKSDAGKSDVARNDQIVAKSDSNASRLESVKQTVESCDKILEATADKVDLNPKKVDDEVLSKLGKDESNKDAVELPLKKDESKFNKAEPKVTKSQSDSVLNKQSAVQAETKMVEVELQIGKTLPKTAGDMVQKAGKPESKAGKPESKAGKLESKAGKPESKADNPEPKAEKSESKAEKPESKPEKSESKAEKSESKAEKSESKAEKSESKAEKDQVKTSKEALQKDLPKRKAESSKLLKDKSKMGKGDYSANVDEKPEMDKVKSCSEKAELKSGKEVVTPGKVESALEIEDSNKQTGVLKDGKDKISVENDIVETKQDESTVGRDVAKGVATDKSKSSSDETKPVKEKSKIGKAETASEKVETVVTSDESKVVGKGETKVGKDKNRTERGDTKLNKEKIKVAKEVTNLAKTEIPVKKDEPNIGKDRLDGAHVETKEETDNSRDGKDKAKSGKQDSSSVSKDISKSGKDESQIEKESVRQKVDEHRAGKEEASLVRTDPSTVPNDEPKMCDALELKLTEVSVVIKETIFTKETHVVKAVPRVVLEETRLTKEAVKATAKSVEQQEEECESTVETEATSGGKVGKKERRKQRNKKPEKRKSATVVACDGSGDDNNAEVAAASVDEPKLKKRKSERESKVKQRSRDKRSKSKKGEGAESSKKRKGRRRDWKRKRADIAGTSHMGLAERDAGESDADASTASSDGGPAVRKQKERRSKKHKGEQERKRGGKRGGSKGGAISRADEQQQPIQGTTSDESGGHTEVKRKGAKSKRKRDKEREKAAAAAAAARGAATSDDSSEMEAIPAKSNITPSSTVTTTAIPSQPTQAQQQQQQDAWMTFVGANKEKIEADAGRSTVSLPSRDEQATPKERRDISSYLICDENVPASPLAADVAGQTADEDASAPATTGAKAAKMSDNAATSMPFVPLTMRHKIGGAESSSSSSSSMAVLDNTPPTTPESAVRALAPSEVAPPTRRSWDDRSFPSIAHSADASSTAAPTSLTPEVRQTVASSDGRLEHLERVQRLLEQCNQGDRDLLDLAGLETRRGRGGSSGEGLLEGLAAVAGAKREQAATAASLEEVAAPPRRRRRNLRKHHHQLPAGCDTAQRQTGSALNTMYGRHRHSSGKNLKGSDTEDQLPSAYHSMGSTSSPPQHSTRHILDQHLLQQQQQQSSPRPSRFNFYVELDDYSDGAERIAVLQEKLTELRKTYLALKAEVACIDRRRKKLKRKEKEASNGTNLSSAVLECS